MIVLGSRLFGKVDHVPGHFHVATKFYHLNFIPLIPEGSWVVLEGSVKSRGLGTSWQGVKLGKLHWASVRMAWLRFGLVVLAIVAPFVALAQAPVAAAAPLSIVAAAGAVAGLVASYRLARARPEQAAALCRTLNLSEDAAAQVRRVASGR
jgi:hypothetical protein